MARLTLTLAGTALGLFGLIGTAAADVPGYTLPHANLRAGPGRDYPLISLVPPGQPTQIFGCVDGWGWCDVAVDGMRGWISDTRLQVLYDNRRVGLSYYAPRLALPVIQFDIGTYWGQYYQGRPFYADRDRWERGGHFGGPPPPAFSGRPGYGDGHPQPSPTVARPPLAHPDEAGHAAPQPGVTRAPAPDTHTKPPTPDKDHAPGAPPPQ
jgi:uncharacterized protein YraI